MPAEIREIMQADDPRLGAVGTIYTEAIAAVERKPLDWLLTLPGKAGYRVLICEQVEWVRGMAVVFQTADFSLLEYLAVDRAARGSGVGTQLFYAAAAVAGGRPLLIEVDVPTDEPSTRRQRFYHRLGCRTVHGVDYRMPLTSPPLPMDLMTFPAEPQVGIETVRRWIQTIHRRVYQTQI